MTAVGYQVSVTRWYASEGRQRWDSSIFPTYEMADFYAKLACLRGDDADEKVVAKIFQTEDGRQETFLAEQRTN